MPRRQTRGVSHVTTRLEPGTGRLDKRLNETVRPDDALVESDNQRMDDLTVSRRKGMARVTVLETHPDTNGSWTLGTDHTTFGTITAASQMQIPEGGFALHVACTAARPSSGTAYLLNAPISAATLAGPVDITLATNGAFTFTWRKASDSSAVSITSATVADGSIASFLLHFDANAGTSRLYKDGDETGTAVTSITATEKIMQNSVNWYAGARGNTTGTPETGTGFTGRMDSLYLMSFRGTKESAGDPSILDELRKIIFQEHPNPASGMMAFCYDLNEASGTTVTDRSRYKNNMTLAGSPSSTTACSYPAQNTNVVQIVQAANGKRSNVWARGGDLYYEIVREATT